jgi:hypothetical protein
MSENYELNRLNAPPNNIIFMNAQHGEVMRITTDAIVVAEGISMDVAAQGVIAALERYLHELVRKSVEQEREECAKVCDRWVINRYDTNLLSAAIRARGQQ